MFQAAYNPLSKNIDGYNYLCFSLISWSNCSKIDGSMPKYDLIFNVIILASCFLFPSGQDFWMRKGRDVEFLQTGVT